MRAPSTKADRKTDARALGTLEGVRIAQEDLHQSGGTYDLDQVRALMGGISRQAVRRRVQNGTMLAIPSSRNRRKYPALQFKSDGTLVDGLKSVREALPTSNPWVMINFLVQADERLVGRRPLDLLKDGDIELVVEAARRIALQGA